MTHSQLLSMKDYDTTHRRGTCTACPHLFQRSPTSEEIHFSSYLSMTSNFHLPDECYNQVTRWPRSTDFVQDQQQVRFPVVYPFCFVTLIRFVGGCLHVIVIVTCTAAGSCFSRHIHIDLVIVRATRTMIVIYLNVNAEAIQIKYYSMYLLSIFKTGFSSLAGNAIMQ